MASSKIRPMSTVAILGLLIPCLPVVAEPTFTTQAKVPVSMPDGVHLATDVYLPTEGTTFPVVLFRTPYGKTGQKWFGEILAPDGYAVVIQDVRGQVGSEGTFHPFVNERKDGLATLEWIARQPWCDGNIGMFGSSYPGFCALVLAPSQHPNLKAILQISGWGDSQSFVTPGGAMDLMFSLAWSLATQIHGSGSFSDYDWPNVFSRTPVRDITRLIGVKSPVWQFMVHDWIEDASHYKASIAQEYDKIATPILHLTGWNDFLARHTLDVYENVAESSKPPFQKLIVGPWGHDQYWSSRRTKIGDEDFGPESPLGDRLDAIILHWFDHWLKGDDNSVTKEKPVRLFVMGPNKWRTFDRYPPSSVVFKKLYLDSDGDARTLSGNGRLSMTPPVRGGLDTFVYDPNNPVPTLGGIHFHHFDDNLGPRDQRPVEKRQDVLVYTSHPLEEDWELVGPLRAVLYASSQGRSTDFTAKLVAVRPDGYARIIEDGIKRGPDLGKGQQSVVMSPGKVYPFTVDLGDTGILVPKGHRLRVEVSSSNFPKFTRNSNTGEVPELATKLRKVKQEIVHSSEYPSHFLVPILK